MESAESLITLKNDNSDTIHLSEHDVNLINVLAGEIPNKNDSLPQECREEQNILFDKDENISIPRSGI